MAHEVIDNSVSSPDESLDWKLAGEIAKLVENKMEMFMKGESQLASEVAQHRNTVTFPYVLFGLAADSVVIPKVVNLLTKKSKGTVISATPEGIKFTPELFDRRR